MFNDNSSFKRQDKIAVDRAIRAKNVLVIDGDTNLGVLSLQEALKLASDRGLNLMQVPSTITNGTPTCKILDYGKFRYEESKRSKAILKKQRESQIEEKEIVFKPDTALNDLKTKARKAIEFLDNGAKLKITIKCVGREISHPDVFSRKLDEFLELIPGAVATVLSNEFRGRFSYLIFRPGELKK